MTTSFEQFIQEVKKNVDIVNVIGEYLDLKKTGKNYKALCPFHQEKTPSFTVNPVNQVYHCFGCGAGGDVFTFLMEMDHLTFIESLKIMAERANMELPDQSDYQKQKSRKRDRMFTINNLAAKFYNYILLNKKIGQNARKYLEERNFSESEIDNFFLGYAPDHWQVLFNFLTEKGYEPVELQEAGLISKSKNNNYYDKFRGRIIFPIMNIRGEVLAFGGRIINNEDPSIPKYLNSPGTLIYEKGKNLYGIHRAKTSIRQKDSVVIMEGYTDVLRAHKEGIENTVASLGTALTRDQARNLVRFAETAYIIFDSDTAGQKAALKGLDILKEEGLNVKVVDLPEGQDPDDFLVENGSAELKKLMDKAPGVVDYKIEKAAAGKNLDNPEEKISLIKAMIKIIAEIEDPVEKEVYLQKISKKYKIDEEILVEEIKKYKKKDKNEEKRYTKNKTETREISVQKKVQFKILKIFIDYPEYREQIQEQLKPKYFNDLFENVAELLWRNAQRDINYIVGEVEDDDLRKILMKLAVNENISTNQTTVNGLIENMKENIYFKSKKKIYGKLKNETGITPDSLNDLLLKYKKMDSYFREEEV